MRRPKEIKGLPHGGPFSFAKQRHTCDESSGRIEVRGYRKKVISRFIIPPYVDAYTRFPFLNEDA